MTRKRTQIPKYSHHKATNRAFVKINGTFIYLGRYGSQASRHEYDRIIGEWIANGRSLPQEPDAIQIDDLIVRFLDHAEKHYRKNGRSTGSKERFVIVLRPLHELYGQTSVSEFGPLALKSVRNKMLKGGLARKTINSRISLIKQVFSWGCENELVPVEVVQRLRTVRGLQAGRTSAPERKPVKPVADEVVEKTLPFCPPMVADMVRLQQLTGSRPNEITQMRSCDVNRGGTVWTYVPMENKMEHHGRERIIPIGPKAQAILTPYLMDASSSTDFLFSPRVSETVRKAELRRKRKTKVQPSQQDRSKPCHKTRLGEKYTTGSYRRAIQRAANLAGVEKWSPNQLRHSTLTEIRKKYGLEAAQIIGGHARADVTQVYAERDLAKAMQIIQEIG